MLSKKEREYLSGKLKLSKNYEHKIEHSIRKKIKTLYQTELPLLQNLSWVEDSRCEASRTDWLLGKLTSCQSGLTPLRETTTKHYLYTYGLFSATNEFLYQINK